MVEIQPSEGESARYLSPEAWKGVCISSPVELYLRADFHFSGNFPTFRRVCICNELIRGPHSCFYLSFYIQDAPRFLRRLLPGAFFQKVKSTKSSFAKMIVPTAWIQISSRNMVLRTRYGESWRLPGKETPRYVHLSPVLWSCGKTKTSKILRTCYDLHLLRLL
jgi:hypothetical protein